MPDPLDQLRALDRPVDPRPTFARALRRQILDALDVDPTEIAANIPMRSTTMTDITATGRLAVGGRTTLDGIWPVIAYDDPFAAIRFLVDVVGFEEHLVVTHPDDPGQLVHSELRWPEGGCVQIAGRDPSNVHLSLITGASMYVITADPQAVHDRCSAAGVEIVVPLHEVEYDVPGSAGFSMRDPGGNIWSFGHYGMAR